MIKGSSVKFNGLSDNADVNKVALYGRLKKDKTYSVLAAFGDANPARSDGRLGPVILSETLIVLEDESGYLTEFSTKTGMFTVVSEAQPCAETAIFADRQAKLSPIYKPCPVHRAAAPVRDFTATGASL